MINLFKIEHFLNKKTIQSVLKVIKQRPRFS